MEITPHTNFDVVTRLFIDHENPVAGKMVEVRGAYEHSSAWIEAIKSTPDVRVEAVARAEELIRNVDYPPSVMFQCIARLLGIHLVASSGDKTSH